MRTPPRSARFALSAIVIASLAACGGGNDDDGGNTPPASESRSGVVVADQPVSGVTVCLDLNANGACDTGEPAAQTDAQGAYSVKTTAAQSSASVIALMTQAAGASSPYVLRQVPGKGGQINPLTTLVAAGVARVVVACEDASPFASGQGAERLRAAGVVVQLGVLADEAAPLYVGYDARGDLA